MKETNFARAITTFLTEYLPGHRNVSKNTIRSYRDVIKQLLQFIEKTYNIKPERLTFFDINNKEVISFLEWLEVEKHVSISTRNQRLAAIHSFYRYAQHEYPEILNVSQKILGIPFKKVQTKPVGHLEIKCMEKLLNEPDVKTLRGLRDCAILTILYDSAARVQELIDIKISDVRLLTPAIIKLNGKGNKTRIVPITEKAKKILMIYMQNYSLLEDSKQTLPLFHNNRYDKFTRPGITYILKKYYAKAKSNYQDLPWMDNISPHLFRHSKAIHMLDAGIPLIYIRDYLGHVSITTTEIYLRSERKIKREALEKLYPISSNEKIPQWSENKHLISWLNDLCK